MKELEQSKKRLVIDPYFPYEEKVLVKRFNKTFLCDVRATEKAMVVIGKEPNKVWEGTHEVHYIERGESMYASPHYRDRVCVQLQKEDRIKAERRALWDK
jgi:hypothetical protein